MNRLFAIIFLILLVACSAQKQLQKIYVGKQLSLIKEEFGEPKTVLERGTDKIYIFENRKELKSTEVNQGKLALDPMITPGVTKTERYYFTVVDGRVSKIKLEEEYER